MNVGVFLLLALGLNPNPALSERGFERLRTGMSLPEMVVVLGAQPGEYADRLSRDEVHELHVFAMTYDDPCAIKSWGHWVSNEGAIHVGLDGEGKALCKFFVRREARGVATSNR